MDALQNGDDEGKQQFLRHQMALMSSQRAMFINPEQLNTPELAMRRQETFGAMMKPVSVNQHDERNADPGSEDQQEVANAASEKQDYKQSVAEQRAERTPIQQTDLLEVNSDEKHRADKGNSDGLLASANNNPMKELRYQKLLESVHSNTDQQIAKIKQTLVATIESKKEILMQSARTEKDQP